MENGFGSAATSRQSATEALEGPIVSKVGPSVYQGTVTRRKQMRKMGPIEWTEAAELRGGRGGPRSRVDEAELDQGSFQNQPSGDTHEGLQSCVSHMRTGQAGRATPQKTPESRNTDPASATLASEQEKRKLPGDRAAMLLLSGASCRQANQHPSKSWGSGATATDVPDSASVCTVRPRCIPGRASPLLTAASCSTVGLAPVLLT